MEFLKDLVRNWCRKRKVKKEVRFRLLAEKWVHRGRSKIHRSELVGREESESNEVEEGRTTTGKWGSLLIRDWDEDLCRPSHWILYQKKPKRLGSRK